MQMRCWWSKRRLREGLPMEKVTFRVTSRRSLSRSFERAPLTAITNAPSLPFNQPLHPTLNSFSILVTTEIHLSVFCRGNA